MFCKSFVWRTLKQAPSRRSPGALGRNFAGLFRTYHSCQIKVSFRLLPSRRARPIRIKATHSAQHSATFSFFLPPHRPPRGPTFPSSALYSSTTMAPQQQAKSSGQHACKTVVKNPRGKSTAAPADASDFQGETLSTSDPCAAAWTFFDNDACCRWLLHSRRTLSRPPPAGPSPLSFVTCFPYRWSSFLPTYPALTLLFFILAIVRNCPVCN
jgi:hypothetical protein